MTNQLQVQESLTCVQEYVQAIQDRSPISQLTDQIDWTTIDTMFVLFSGICS